MPHAAARRGPRWNRDRTNSLLAGDSVIFGVSANPEPLHTLRHVVRQGAVVFANANRPKLPDALEMKRRMLRICFEKLEILVRDASRCLGQLVVESSEASRRKVLQSGRDFFALCSAIDSSMRRSSFPAAASASI